MIHVRASFICIIYIHFTIIIVRNQTVLKISNKKNVCDKFDMNGKFIFDIYYTKTYLKYF